MPARDGFIGDDRGLLHGVQSLKYQSLNLPNYAVYAYLKTIKPATIRINKTEFELVMMMIDQK